MLNNNYKEAISETLEILKHTNKDAKRKISKNFLIFLKSNKSKTFEIKQDYSKPIRELELNPKTEAILGIIYLKYWASKEERDRFIKRVNENEKYLETEFKKADVGDLFKHNKVDVADNNKEENLPQPQIKESLFKRLINRIKLFLGGDRNER